MFDRSDTLSTSARQERDCDSSAHKNFTCSRSRVPFQLSDMCKKKKKKLMKKVPRVCKSARWVFTSSSLSMIKQIFLSPVLSVFSVEAFSFVFSPGPIKHLPDLHIFYNFNWITHILAKSIKWFVYSFKWYLGILKVSATHFCDIVHICQTYCLTDRK
jgi:hypothetical protein